MVESVDDSVGRITRKLDELGLSDNTIVVFTSDNGGLSVKEGAHTPATSNAPLRAGKGYLYEGGIRVPLIIRWPATVLGAAECDTPVVSMDLYVTLHVAASLRDAHASLEETRRRDGQSLLPLLQQQNGFPPRALYWHYPHYSNQGGKPSGAIREGDWKLIEFFEDGRRELYNLKSDPVENHDLAAQERETAAALAARLAEWRKQLAAKMPTPNPDYKAGN
jgi:arylsulfatase A-like enzyme